MLQFKSLIRPTLLLSAAIAAAACAPKDEQLTGGRSGNGGGNGGNGGGGTAAAFDVEGREVDFARHTALKVGELRRMIDIALALPTRASVPLDKSIDLSGKCRTLKRMSPSPDRKIPAFYEELMVNYFKCNEASEKTAEASKSGPETYFVTYGAAIPKEEDPNRVYPFPTMMVVKANTVRVQFKLKSHKNDRLQITQGVDVNVGLVAEDETTLTYNAWFNSDDAFDYDVGKVRRKGDVFAQLKKAEVKVDKASRKVTNITVPNMSFEMRGEQFDKSDFKGTQLLNRKEMRAYLSFKAQDTLKISANACDVPQGVFSMTNETNREQPTTGTVTLGQGKVVVQGADASDITTKDVKFCKDQSDEPTFLEDLESVYF